MSLSGPNGVHVCCRSDLAWKECFANAGLKLIHEQTQGGFPEHLYPVKMYVVEKWPYKTHEY